MLKACLCILMLGGAMGLFAENSKLEPVRGFDLNRYLGTWYEVARMPFRFEKDLVNVTATYTMKPNGKVAVLNQGYKYSKNGKKSVAKGVAKFAAAPDVAHLRVSFFRPFYSDYIVFELDPNYQFAVVGSGSKYMWILSRKPKMDSEQMNNLVMKAGQRGYDTSKLIYTQQE